MNTNAVAPFNTLWNIHRMLSGVSDGPSFQGDFSDVELIAHPSMNTAELELAEGGSVLTPEERVVPKEAIEAIKRDPDSKTARSTFRVTAGRKIPDAVQGSDNIMQWIRETWAAEIAALPAAGVPVGDVPETYTRMPDVPSERPIRFKINAKAKRTVVEDIAYNGEVSVPRDVVNQGEAAIEQYIRERYTQIPPTVESRDGDSATPGQIESLSFSRR